MWRDGGPSGDGFQAAGMQQLHDAVRAAGAENLVIAGGLDYGFDLSGVPAHRIAGTNVLYATHPYDFVGKQPADWDAAWGFLAATDAVIVTEFGTSDCGTAFYSNLITEADARDVSWVAWAWYPGGCNFPALIIDLDGNPNAPGQVVKDALASY